MVYVENAAQAHLQAADALAAGSPVCGRAYFISQGEPVNCWQWIDEVLALAGLPPVERSISLATAWRIGAVLEAAYRVFRLRGEPRMTRFLAAQLGTSHYFNIAAARRDFGYQPAIDKAEGMRRLGEQLALDAVATALIGRRTALTLCAGSLRTLLCKAKPPFCRPESSAACQSRPNPIVSRVLVTPGKVGNDCGCD